MTSHGTKVDLGRNAPKKQEGPGEVLSDSLAAESQAFRKENEVEQHGTGRPQESAHAPGTSTKYASESRSAAPAPSYVDAQRMQPVHDRPHGKNITESNDLTEDRSKNASFSAEIGSKDDPSLLAEQKLSKQNTSVSGSTGGREKSLDTDTAYDALGEQEA
ncbi:hypothetical protein F5Y18DRAFT_382303 [Xylariaceae sp. FL1019]|nr:hypothetical protein F5Y18DRAFT_382303 [Xylariaceae sp. FL1019]